MLIVIAVAVVGSVAASRLTSRLMPLVVLLKMTMIFPDKAPSRLKVARRTTSMSDIKARLNSPRLDEKDAATTMLALVTALGRHDRHTRGHSERVRLFCDLLSRELGLSEGDMGRLRWAALVHDVGKLQIPVAVLNKPAKLNEKEWDLIRQHPDAGARLAAPLREWLGPWFSGIAEHHERYDGMGYPRGLTGSAISTAGRAIAVVDAFETMTASRSYKAARSTLSARAELTKCAGSHFDPVMVRAFLGIALPRLLWSVGPLAFIVNVPFLQWIGTSGTRIGDVVGATTTGAANAAGITAMAVAVSATPAVAGTTTPESHVHRSVAGRTQHASGAGAAQTAAGSVSRDDRAAGSHSAMKAAAPARDPKTPPGPSSTQKKAPPAKKAAPAKKAPSAKKAAPVKKAAPATKAVPALPFALFTPGTVEGQHRSHKVKKPKHHAPGAP